MLFYACFAVINPFFSPVGHFGSSYSLSLRQTASNPGWLERDRLLFSKGHACAVLYSAMAYRGYFSVEELSSFRKLDSRLQGHPDRQKLPGIEIPAGPLGHGIAIGVGMALALKSGGKPSSNSAPSSRASQARVVVVLGDGEINAGVVWEGALAAAKYRLGNLVAILDYNGIQQTGATADVLPTEPIADKWMSFGWHVQEIDGHNVSEILNALDRADEVHARPSMIIARTTKGKGVSFMEYDHRWHGISPDKGQFEEALTELQAGLIQWQP
jgi:transketolase